MTRTNDMRTYRGDRNRRRLYNSCLALNKGTRSYQLADDALQHAAAQVLRGRIIHYFHYSRLHRPIRRTDTLPTKDAH